MAKKLKAVVNEAKHILLLFVRVSKCVCVL